MIERRRTVTPQLGVVLPTAEKHPAKSIASRLALALLLVLFMTLVVYVDREGYYDARDGEVTLLDALYYTTVSISTTGYGDVVPATDHARLLTSLVMTPARLAFILILVGTTLAVLTEKSRAAWREERWRKKLKDHVVVCGYGTKGRSVVNTLIACGIDKGQIVVIDRTDNGLREAGLAGLAAINGDSSRVSVLEEAQVREARAIIVAVDRDDAATLTTLTVREMNPRAMISASVRERENVHLLQQSGADSVITSSDAAGRLLGISTVSPSLVTVLEDLLESGKGMELVDRPVKADEVGKPLQQSREQLAVAIVRNGQMIRFNDDATKQLQLGDRIIALTGSPEPPRA